MCYEGKGTDWHFHHVGKLYDMTTYIVHNASLSGSTTTYEEPLAFWSQRTRHDIQWHMDSFFDHRIDMSTTYNAP